MQQQEESNDLLHDAESEIISLKEQAGLLEMSKVSQRGVLEVFKRNIYMAKEQASEMAKEIESLKNELDAVKDEKIQALNNEKFDADSVQTLLEEKNKIINELGNFRKEEENKEAIIRKRAEENGDLTDSEKEYDMLRKVVEFSEQNGHRKKENTNLELPELVKDIPLEESNVLSENRTYENSDLCVRDSVNEREAERRRGWGVDVGPGTTAVSYLNLKCMYIYVYEREIERFGGDGQWRSKGNGRDKAAAWGEEGGRERASGIPVMVVTGGR
ncbi:hypothetical protein AgCh_033509 [Apium graveolens]